MTILPQTTVVAKALSPKWTVATDGLDAEQRQKILNRMKPVSYDSRDILFEEGEPSDTLIVLTEGRVRLFQTLENGEEFTFGITPSGALLGLAALVAGELRILSAEAIEPATASIMTRPDFLRCVEVIPRFHWNITRLLAMLSMESIQRSGPMVLDVATVRLGGILKSLARPDENDAASERLHIHGMTQADLAKMVGVSRSWIVVALAQFERLGLISKSRGRITIHSARRFESFILAERNQH